MNRTTAGTRWVLAACIVALPAAGWAVAVPPTAPASTALPVAAQHARQAVDRQQIRNRQLQQRVDTLRQGQDQARQQLQQRDRTLQALRRQLDQLAPASAATVSHPPSS